MRKVYQIKFFQDQLSVKKARLECKFLFESEKNAQTVADIIAKEKKLFWQLEEYYI